MGLMGGSRLNFTVGRSGARVKLTIDVEGLLDERPAWGILARIGNG